MISSSYLLSYYNISFNSGFGVLFFQLPLKQKNLLNNSQTNPLENIFLNQWA